MQPRKAVMMGSYARPFGTLMNAGDGQDVAGNGIQVAGESAVLPRPLNDLDVPDVAVGVSVPGS